MATDNEKTDEIAERLAAVEAKMRDSDPVAKQMANLMRGPVPSPAARDAEARQLAQARAAQEAVAARAELHRLQAIKDAPKQAKRNKEVAALEEQYRGHAAAVEREQQSANEASAAIIALRAKPISREAAALPPIYPPGRPIKVEDDPGDRRRWRVGGR